MINLLEAYALRGNQELRAKVCVACWLVASDIVKESITTPNHDVRLKWAMLAGFTDLNSRVVDSALIAVMRKAVESDIGLDITDKDIVLAIAKAVDHLAILFP